VNVVRAAGGLVVREGQLLLVHRPKYDDWTFPKGKCDDGEADGDCALREVHEETGVRCVLAAELGTTEYTDAHGRPKIVRWWTMRPVADDGFEADHEVDDIRWLAPDEAAGLLSYERDVALLERLR
jgi:8-oxo-dGTP pyrophosphatase MutT (NUDIX family)